MTDDDDRKGCVTWGQMWSRVIPTVFSLLAGGFAVYTYSLHAHTQSTHPRAATKEQVKALDDEVDTLRDNLNRTMSRIEDKLDRVIENNHER